MSLKIFKALTVNCVFYYRASIFSDQHFCLKGCVAVQRPQLIFIKITFLSVIKLQVCLNVFFKQKF